MTAVAADAISYEDLYARWERGNWRATEIDFTEDRRQWQEVFSPFEREAALWNYSLFFWGEDAVADTLAPFVDAAPREEQAYFLATQQVDEARHAVFFKRFMHKVAGIGTVARVEAPRRRHRLGDAPRRPTAAARAHAGGAGPVARSRCSGTSPTRRPGTFASTTARRDRARPR